VTENLGLEVVLYPHPNKVSRINSTAIGVQQLNLIPIEFHLYFWRTMWHMLDTKSKFSTAFQSQIDCQTKVINESAWYTNWSLSKSHHESASSFASLHVHKSHKKINIRWFKAMSTTSYEMTIGNNLKLLMLVMFCILVALICLLKKLMIVHMLVIFLKILVSILHSILKI